MASSSEEARLRSENALLKHELVHAQTILEQRMAVIASLEQTLSVARTTKDDSWEMVGLLAHGILE